MIGSALTEKDEKAMNKRIKKKHSLKPCPFCGDAGELNYDYFFSAWVVGCGRFGCESLYYMFVRGKKKDAIRAWNRYAKKNRRKTDGAY